ncbi:hypothetical protein [Paenibacillus chitinolyticus]|uniref:hypothetical protein n=1 Tax=Paenibacillus chitinolyticus TaxID=79263 RepID=UPI003D003FE0
MSKIEILFTVVFDESTGKIHVMIDEAVRGKLTEEDESQITNHAESIIQIVGGRMNKT